MLYVALDVVTKTSFLVVYLNLAVPACVPQWMAACTHVCFGKLYTPEGGTARAEARTEGHGSAPDDEEQRSD